jgi:hypothetical protein
MKLLLTILSLLVASSVEAATYYVATTGSDAVSCSTAQTIGTPKLTIVAGIGCLTTAGDTLQIRGGTYNEYIDGNTVNIPSGSSFSNPVTIKSYSNEIVTLTSVSGNGLVNMNTDTALNTAMRFIIFDGTGASPNYGIVFNGAGTTNGRGNVFVGGTVSGGAQSIRFTGVRSYNNGLSNPTTKPGSGFLVAGESNEFLNCSADNNGAVTNWAGAGFTGNEAPYGFYINTHNHTIRNCKIYNNGGWGTQAYSASNAAYNLLFEQNTVYNNGRNFPQGSGGIWGGSSGASGGTIIRNNLFYWTGATAGTPAPSIYMLGTGPVAYNNTVMNNPSGGIVTELSTSAVVRNNIIYNNGTAPSHYANFDASGSGLIHNSNLITDPRVVDAANGDFRLCTGAGTPHANCVGVSPAIDTTGATIPSVTVDIVNTQRPVGTIYDIGAYEAGETVPIEPTPILVAEISCDNTVVDSSGNANHGTLTSGATYSASGKYNSACSFDGVDDSVTLADSTTLDLTHGFTLEAWTFPTSVTTDAVVMVKNPNSKYGLFVSLDGQCGTDATVGGFSETSFNRACYATATSLNTWTHHAVTYDRTNIIYYRNGVLVTNTAASAFLSATSGTLQIGNSGFSEPFTGLIDEVRIYNYARSAAQVLTDMNTPINAAVPNTVTVRMASTTMKFAGSVLKFGSSTAATPSYILLENGDNWLLEDGDDLLNQQ